MKKRVPFLVLTLLILSQTALFGFGQTESRPPEVAIETRNMVYISPQLSDGTQDQLVIPINVKPSENKVIKELYCIIDAENDTTVRTIALVYDGPKAGLFQKENGIEIPDQLVWDGKNDNGDWVSDGRYYYRIEVLDSDVRRGHSRTNQVIVDNTPPQVDLNAPHTVFSPIESAGRNLFIMEQEGSLERLWEGSISDSDGNIVRNFQWKKSEPPNFSWNGRDNQGNLAADGSYSYTITATDEAGNQIEKDFGNIVIDTTAANININRSRPAFSPNGDGVQDTLALFIDIPVSDNLIEWSAIVRDQNDNPVRSFPTEGGLKKEISFDGRDNRGNLLPDGEYRAHISALYRNGNNPQAETSPFEIDSAPPQVSVTLENARFSPDGDGTKDSAIFRQETSAEESWEGVITDQSGTIVRKEVWRGTADEIFPWDGRDDSGDPLPDGAYTYRLSSTDEAGNKGVSRKLTLNINTEVKAAISLTLDHTHISPNSDEGNKNVTLTPSVDNPDGLRRFILAIRDPAGNLVWKREKTPEEWTGDPVTWNGRDQGQNLVADGPYRVRFAIVDELGNQKQIEHTLEVDTKRPAIDLAADYTLFSPNGDGRKDEITISQDSSREPLWEGFILDNDSRKIRSFFWKGTAEDLVWNGKNDEGEPVPDGLYTYYVEAVDLAGNSTKVELENIVVDTKATPVDLRWSEGAFSPNNDGKMDEAGLDLYIEVQEEIESWEVRILDTGSNRIKSFSGDGALPKKISWDGSTASNNPAEEGRYTAELTVRYIKGNLAEKATENSTTLDLTPPQLAITLEPQRFSPNGDGRDDLQNILIDAEDRNSLMEWSLNIYETKGELFYARSGEGSPPQKIEWDGRSSEDELVQTAKEYPLTIKVWDGAGNLTEQRQIISVDIFATRRDDNLIIEISSLLFAPNSAEFTDFGRYSDFYESQKEKNMRILDQIAEMLKQYSDYSIVIEGHGVLVHWDDPALAKLEQEKELIPLTKNRAEAVKAALAARGIAADRMTTVGVGGANPAYPFQDRENRWKNRRVIFILEK